MFKEMVKAEVALAMEMASEFYGKPMPPVTIKFSNRMTRSGGQCSYFRKPPHNYTLKFSVDIMNRNDITEFIDQAVYHEVAHLVQHVAYGKGDHGETFKYIMRKVFNRTWRQSKRTHSFETAPKRKMTRYVWSCPCGHEYRVTSQKHKKYSDRIRKPFHPACGEANGRVYFTGKTVKV